MTVQARSLQNWATEVNKMLATGTPPLIGDILTRAIALKKEVQSRKVLACLCLVVRFADDVDDASSLRTTRQQRRTWRTKSLRMMKALKETMVATLIWRVRSSRRGTVFLL